MAGPRRQSGQVMILVTILAIVLLLAGLLVYNVGRVNLVRTRLQNTADSAAYSSAVLMARAYNFTAYSNRAMVANQVAIAQMVSLASWSRFYCTVFNDSCGRFNSLGTDRVITLGLELFGGQPGKTVNKAYQKISNGAFSALNKVTGPVITVLNTLEQALSGASYTYLTDTPLEIPFAAQAVVTANDPNATLSLPGWASAFASAGQLTNFVKQYTPLNRKDDPGNRFHNVTVASLDTWTRSRAGPEMPPFVEGLWAGPRCLGDGVGAIIFTGGWSGSASLSADNTQWSAQDQGSYIGIGLCVIIADIIPIPIPILIPTPPSIGQGIVGGEIVDKKWQIDNGTYSGLQPYMGLANIADTKADWHSPTITLFVERPTASVDTTAQMLAHGQSIAGGQLQLNDSQAANEMQVASSAEAYFIRPDGQWDLGGHLVYGNFFNPYWEAHLVPTPAPLLTSEDVCQARGLPC